MLTIYKNKTNHLLIFLTMVFVTFKVVCNVLFFRQIEPLFFNYDIKIVASAIFFPFVYVISDAIILISNRKTAILIIIFGMICDGIFSLGIYGISTLSTPNFMSNSELQFTNSVNKIGMKMWQLFYQGVIGSCIAAIVEILIFYHLYNRLQNFILSTIFSVSITLICHNLINDYSMLHNEPDVWQLITNTLMINISVITIYVLLVYSIMKIRLWQNPFNFCTSYFYGCYNLFVKRIENKALRKHELRLVDRKMLMEESTDQPYFLISDSKSITNKLYINDWIQNHSLYEEQFSKKDCGIMITESLKAIIDKYKLEKDIVDLSGRVMHDIGSPLLIMGIAINNLKRTDVSKENVELLEKSIENIRKITDSLLKPYREIKIISSNKDILDENNQYIMLDGLIEELLCMKEIEWNNKKCIVSFERESFNKDYWFKVNSTEIRRKLSNLLNNSYESLNKKGHKIKVSLKIVNNNFEIIIKDNGCGIPQNKISEVMQGISLKHSGSGIGLSSAKNYFKLLGGELLIESKINEGTKVSIILPVSQNPIWYPQVIKHNTNTTFVVLDDNQEIHSVWQNTFAKKGIQSYHFTIPEDLFKWFELNDTSNTVFFIDYELNHNEYNGLSIINKLNIRSNTYLITSAAEDAYVQNNVANMGIYLIPKQVGYRINFQKI